MHRINAAERDIRKWENIFIAGICGLGKFSPMTLWCCLLQQEKIKLNLLHTARSNPKLSAHETQEGIFDFNKKSLDPTGTKVIVHGNPGNVSHGILTECMGGTLDKQWKTIYVTRSTSIKYGWNERTKQFIFYHRTKICLDYPPKKPLPTKPWIW